MNPLDNNQDCDVAKYFKNLGYDYSWDFDKELHWHELYKDGKLIMQVEMVPLKDIIRDMCVVKDIQLDYWAAGSKDTYPLYIEMCDKVREYEKTNKRTD